MDNKPHFEGLYEDINDNTSRTIIKKINDNKYEVMAEFDQNIRFTTTPKNNNYLVGIFRGVQTEMEFNTTFDTIYGRSSGNLIFTIVRIRK
jgi:hypothetical protein